jgi:Fur family ferric uptake transcriptional regulator
LLYTGAHHIRTIRTVHRFHEEAFVNLGAKDLKKVGLKVTLPRVKILALLTDQADSHLSAEDIYKALLESGEEIGLATVYRVLTQFEAAGLVKRHHFEGNQSVFELDEGSHHDHLVCVTCGEIVEFYDEVIEERQQAVVRDLGFRLEEHSMILYAECRRPACPNRRGD